MSGPLDGVRVVDFTSVIMGPWATQILGDLGADVITIEEPGGALNRVMSAGPHPQLSGIALNLLRNKRNIVLDAKSTAGRNALERLMATADVFVTNVRPKALASLGLQYEDIAAIKPDIIFCQAQGWPKGSENENAPAYDDIIQAASGIPDVFVRAYGEAQYVPSVIADKVSGITIAYGIIAALFGRERTGRGQHLEVPMVDAMAAFLLVEHGAAATAVPAQGSAGYPRILNPERRPQKTVDGYVAILPYSRQNYIDIFTAAERADLIDDRIRGARAIVANSESLYRDLAELVAKESTSYWLDLAGRLGIPATSIPTLDELVEGLPITAHPLVGDYHVIPQPIRFSDSAGDPAVRLPAALPGEHTRDLLTEVGVPASAIEEIIADAGRSRAERRTTSGQKP